MVNNQKKENEGPTPTEEVQLLFVRNENAIRAFIRALQPSLSDADDVLKETFLTVTRKASSFEIGTNFSKNRSNSTATTSSLPANRD
ncbi:MAG: hypothetical protein CMD87_00090 [Gammaproteobacteria bacterium]|nr:hypothetical protein [Gammaproteobacteria bacterium]